MARVNRIKKIGIAQTTKFFVTFYLIISSIFIVPMFLLTFLLGSLDKNNFGPFKLLGGLFIVIIPFIYALIAGVMVALMSFLYNLVAKFTGGVEFEIEESEE